MRICLLFVIVLLGASLRGADSRPVLKLQGNAAELVVDLGGGSIADFHLLADGLNPLQWDSWYFRAESEGDPPMEPRPMGHFICLDRWGSSSPAEKAHGMPNHGEAGIVWWEVTRKPQPINGKIEASMTAHLPMAGLRIDRTIGLLENEAAVLVTESVTNLNPIGRIYNFVQHPSIGGTFLNENTVVDSNGARGFMQEGSLSNPEERVVNWPRAAKLDGTEVDVRYLADDDQPAVVTYLVEDEYGWVTASSPDNGVLIGYFWKTSEFPWLNIWRNVRAGKPYARGLEFGTSGLHKPGHALVAKSKIFDRAIYRYIDASETQTFRYANFLLAIPEDFAGVFEVAYKNGNLTIVEAGSKKRRYDLVVGELF